MKILTKKIRNVTVDDCYGLVGKDATIMHRDCGGKPYLSYLKDISKASYPGNKISLRCEKCIQEIFIVSGSIESFKNFYGIEFIEVETDNLKDIYRIINVNEGSLSYTKTMPFDINEKLKYYGLEKAEPQQGESK